MQFLIQLNQLRLKQVVQVHLELMANMVLQHYLLTYISNLEIA